MMWTNSCHVNIEGTSTSCNDFVMTNGELTCFQAKIMTIIGEYANKKLNTQDRLQGECKPLLHQENVIQKEAYYYYY